MQLTRCAQPSLKKSKAQQVLAQKDRILAQAQEEANRTIQLAREKAEQIVSRDQISQGARLCRSNDCRSPAGCRPHADADQYVLQSLTNMEMEIGADPHPGSQWHSHIAKSTGWLAES